MQRPADPAQIDASGPVARIQNRALRFGAEGLHDPARVASPPSPSDIRRAKPAPRQSALPTRLPDPIHEHQDFALKDSKVAIAGHPIHAMMVAFPIALCMCTFGADLMYWLTGDIFWPRAALWGAGVAFGMAVLAGVVGTAELLLVPGIRIRTASWTHFILAVMLISVLGANWGYRLPDPVGNVLPFGVLASALAAGLTALTGWHGGKLVFDYGIGISPHHDLHETAHQRSPETAESAESSASGKSM